MKKIFNLEFVVSIVCLALFVFLICLLKFVDVQAIGPQASVVGLATLNQIVYNSIGFNSFWYYLTEIFGYMAILLAVCFGGLGVYQLFKGKSFKKVDKNLYALLFVYVLLAIVYILFEKIIINYRPILNEELEPSFPSSHTMLGLTLFGTGLIAIDSYIKDKKVNLTIKIIAFVIMFLMVVGRALSGVHWFTDILGGVIISAFLISLYSGLVKALN